ncbi:MAG: glycosyltransferase family 4 protein [Alphaproteobacteria bacterium]|nr:glycosyltransferase family 4 protein [Alphaproteobacteria bacterium]MBV9583975.1 glycosyltransferase family 4 protein [Alphaproteobacteria bacterium]
MSRRTYFDGLNLALPRGTGIATYTRLLASIVHDLGYETGVVYSSPGRPPKNPLLREISFFDYRGDKKVPILREIWDGLTDQVRSPFGIKPSPLNLSGVVVTDQFEARLASSENLFVARNLFANARRYFSWSGRFTDLEFDEPPDILHCTYQLPIRAKGACNVYTIHDLVPLRLPFTTLDNKRQTYRLLRKIGAEADHIVTVSEHSRCDIIELLGVDEKRVTNTYEAVEFPREFVERPDDVVAEQLRGSFGLTPKNYLLFYGALEPKKNVRRLIDSFMLSAVDIPLVITGAGGWGNQAEAKWLSDMREEERAQSREKRRIHHFEYVSVPMLVTLIRGARAVLFPSLYEGFGLPVLEAMRLGTPVVTSRTSSLPEIAGDAALYVNPYETDDITRAIKTITADADLREELVRRGRAQAELFSVERYRQRIAALYDRLR